MSKSGKKIRIFAVLSCMVIAVSVFPACSKKESEKGSEKRSSGETENTTTDFELPDYVVVNDAIRSESEENLEFYVMRIKEDYVVLPGPGKYKRLYCRSGVEYPEMEDGQVARVVADVDIVTGGFAGYRGDYFLVELEKMESIDFEEFVGMIPLMNVKANNFGYRDWTVYYPYYGETYVLVLYLDRIEVYTKDGPFMEYEYGDDETLVVQFFERIGKTV